MVKCKQSNSSTIEVPFSCFYFLQLTCKNEPPECTGRSLYFMKHTKLEEQIRGSSSLWNRKEIWLILDVAQYLLKNGYRPCDITVLCPYRGQVSPRLSHVFCVYLETFGLFSGFFFNFIIYF